MTVTEPSTRTRATAPRPPVIDLPYRERLQLLRAFHTGGETARRTGPVAELVLGPARLVPRIVFVSSPEGMHEVLGGFDGTFDKDQIVHVESRTWGANLFNLPHEPWQPRRRALQPLFTKRRVAAYAQHIAAVADAALEVWLRIGTVDLDSEARRLTLEVLGRSVLGMHLGDAAHDLAPHVHRVISYPMRRAGQPLRVPQSWPTPARGRFLRSLAELQAVAREALRNVRDDPDHDAPLVRQLLDAQDPETGRPLTEAEIVNELIVFLLAGHDTTATTIAYTLWQLARHPAIQDRVADEVRALPDRPLTVDDARALPYTVQVIHEALRLCPPAAAVGRIATRDTVVGGYRIDAGVNVILSIYAMQRDPGLWDDPLRFDPDRFAPDRLKQLDRWQYLPFGAGPRSCIGDHFAMLEATLAVASVVRAAEVCSDAVDFPMAVPFTLVAARPVPARFVPRG